MNSLGLTKLEQFGNELRAVAGGDSKRAVGALASGAPLRLHIGSKRSKSKSEIRGTFAKTVNETDTASG
jgi:hypothetical protein